MRATREQLLAECDLSELLEEIGEPRELSPRGKQFPCPSIKHEQSGTSPPVSISHSDDDYDVWHCHGCGVGGTAIDALILSGRVASAGDALALLASKNGVPIGGSVETRSRQSTKSRTFDTQYIDRCRHSLSSNQLAVDRLGALRGWTPEAIEKLGLGLDGDRVIIPVASASGALVGVLRYHPNPQTRGDQPKVVSAPGSQRELFPPPETIDPLATIWLVEGEADAIACTSLGLASCAIPGASSWRAEWAVRFTDRDVVICGDCDTPGRSLANKVADDLLNHAKSVRVIELAAARDDGYDISDLIMETEESERSGVKELLYGFAEDVSPYIPVADRPPKPRLRVEDWRKALFDYIDGKGRTEAWPVPFQSIRDATDGGIRAGEVWVLAGYTSHAKSIYADMLLDNVAKAGARCHLYMTEMTVVQRGLRYLSRKTGVPMHNLRKRAINPKQEEAIRHAIETIPYAATVVTDWTPAQVAADIRNSRVNVAVIDLLHGFHYTDERELSSYVDHFAAAATSDASGGDSGSAVVLVCHLNDAQMREARSPKRPRPGLHSLKGASSIKQRADLVMFSWLQDDENGAAGHEGEVYIAKARNGMPMIQPTYLDINTLTLIEREVM